jgi:hypothetical protein
MGLLDDAIREHLELKRRRGADPSEIAREEAEALGPVRREPAEAEPAAVRMEPSEPSAEHEPAGLEDPGAAYAEDGEDEPVAPSPDRPRPAEPPHVHDAPYPEDEEESATPPHGDPLAHQPTREFSAAELDEALGDTERPAAPQDVVPADDEGEDVLEETPEFLQETPEHDRLWFEQKPPKDFDF